MLLGNYVKIGETEYPYWPYFLIQEIAKQSARSKSSSQGLKKKDDPEKVINSV